MKYTPTDLTVSRGVASSPQYKVFSHRFPNLNEILFSLQSIEQCRENEITQDSVNEIIPVLKLVLAKGNILCFLVTFFAVVYLFFKHKNYFRNFATLVKLAASSVSNSLPSRVSSKQSNFFSVRTETNQNSICFVCFSVCFAKPKNIFSVCFGLFRCFGPVLKQPKQTELCRNKPK